MTMLTPQRMAGYEDVDTNFAAMQKEQISPADMDVMCLEQVE